ncbi:uncharacterized protein VTP21DRAFT_11706 [Calcarisporiella thermophila]|uniref:uncharacterized protein n=1 Tax=Calcarisporiella thermophila TaxID=911321 RepID=UPI003743C67B
MKTPIFIALTIAGLAAVAQGVPTIVSKRGLLDQSVNGAHIVDHLKLFNSMQGSNPQHSENSNANTKANGPGDNSNLSKQSGEGVYKKKKHHHHKRGLIDNTLNGAHVLDHVSAINSMVNSNPQTSENSNANTKANGPGDFSNLSKQGPEGAYVKHHKRSHKLRRGLHRRGVLDNTLNNADVVDHLSLINSMVNSNPQDSENRNANTKASGPGDNSNLSKQGGEGIYYKGGHCDDDDCHHHHWRRGVLDNTLNNADVIDHLSLINSMVNSNPQDSENRNANTKASGPGDNSNLSKQGPEGFYYKGGHHKRGVENRNANTKETGNVGNSVYAQQKTIKPKKGHKNSLQRRGLLDNTLNNADIIDHIEAINSMVNSNPQDSENRNANTKASGPGDNSDLSKQGPEGFYYKGGHYKRGVENRNANTKESGNVSNSVSAQQKTTKPKKGHKNSLQRRGVLDNTLNNADVIDHLSLINSMVNSNPQDSENRNANTKASGPGDNSNLSKQGPEGFYYKGGHHDCGDHC